MTFHILNTLVHQFLLLSQFIEKWMTKSVSLWYRSQREVYLVYEFRMMSTWTKNVEKSFYHDRFSGHCQKFVEMRSRLLLLLQQEAVFFVCLFGFFYFDSLGFSSCFWWYEPCSECAAEQQNHSRQGTRNVVLTVVVIKQFWLEIFKYNTWSGQFSCVSFFLCFMLWHLW